MEVEVNRPVLSAKPRPTQWVIETSHLIAVPESVEVNTLPELRSWVQELANGKWKGDPKHRPFGEILFRYELDDRDEPCVVHCFFTNRHGNRARFMRLRRS